MIKIKSILCALLCTGLSACGGSGPSTPEPTTPVTPQPTVNQPPVVSIGEDRYIIPALELALSATANDQDGAIASYQWTQTFGPQATLSGDTSARVKIKVSQGIPVEQTLGLRLTVTDDDGAQASDDIVLTVKDFFLTPSAATELAAGETLTWTVAGFDSFLHRIDWQFSDDIGMQFSYDNPGSGQFQAPHLSADTVVDFTAKVKQLEGNFERATLSGSMLIKASEGVGIRSEKIAVEGFDIIYGDLQLQTLADLNHDGLADMVYADLNDVVYTLSRASQYFAEHHMLLQTNGNIEVLELADIDGDGFADVIVGYREDFDRHRRILSWFKNLGNGQFGNENIIESNIGSYSRLSTSDLDKDGKVDIVLAHQFVIPGDDGFGPSAAKAQEKRLELAVYFQADNGRFEPRSLLDYNADTPDSDTVNGDVHVLVVDFDNDGHNDILLWPYSADSHSRAYLYLGTDNRYSYLRQAELLNLSPLSDSTQKYAQVSTLDINHDGFIDVVVNFKVAHKTTSDRYSKVVTYLNDGNNGLVSEPLGEFAVPVTLVTGDVDLDGDKDVLIQTTLNTGYGSCNGCGPFHHAAKLQWWENTAAGNLALPKLLSYPGELDNDLKAIDLDNDGDLDFVSSKTLHKALYLHFNQLH